MASLNTKNFSQLTQAFAAGVQSRSTDLIDFSVGSILLAVAEADSAQALWLQALIIQTLAVTRAQTSQGTDLDTFVNQFGVTRLGSSFATGLVTFSRFTAGPTAPFIPNGSLVKTSDGSQQFAVYADLTNPAYSSILGGYTLAASVPSVSVPVRALNGGTQANVSAGTISLIASSLPGIDTDSNGAPFTNGVDAESDQALRARFILFFGSLSKATEAALQYAIVSLQAGVQVAFHENQDPGGAIDYGMVTVYVDDGSGAPPASLITAANAAVALVRAASVRVGVYASSVLLANYSMTLVTAAGYVHGTVVAQVVNAVSAFINSLGLENALPYSQLAAVAYSIPGVLNVTGTLLNGATNDLTPAAGQSIKVGLAVVS